MNVWVQGLIGIIVIGVVYQLWRTNVQFGGQIGSGLRWIGLGLLFFCLEVIDRILGPYSFLGSFSSVSHEIMSYLVSLAGLIFAGIGFSKLKRISK